ncbi:MAG: hypothetical protein KF725_00050 [Cyclobacteriaceae bacterium]|nr:hypothetical protein [Cyclobacteriaceae bacterium]UYN87140.1 MAG: hypothetical protein KIT51_02355 [Cyclobacteriaceae bacterium]
METLNNLQKPEYLRALHNYFHKTKGYINPSIASKVEPEIALVNNYEQMNKVIFLNRRGILIRRILNFAGHVSGVIVYSFLLIYSINQILDLAVNYSIMNISLLVLLIMGWKARFRLSEREGFTNT